MISYNWSDSKELAHKTNDRLSDAGYQVWIDKEQMKGDMYEMMGRAVNNAHVVLMFTSSNYERSANCQSEANYAKDLKKKIIPIRVQKEYEPNPKIGMMTAGLLYYDFSKGSFDDNFKELLHEIESIAGIEMTRKVETKLHKMKIAEAPESIPGIEMTRKVETKLQKMKIAEAPGQSDEILIIDGLGCQQSVVKFNTKTKRWNDMPDTNIARKCPSAVNYNQQILLMGGAKQPTGTRYNSVEMLDLNDENPKWDSNLPSMGEKRYGTASALLNGLVYCAGGYNDTGHLSSCESYNPEEKKWSSIRNMNNNRYLHALVSARGLLYVLGGSHDKRTTNTAECYDPKTGKWEYIPPMKTCRYGLTAVVLNNEIYAIGGYNIPSVEKYNLDTKTWTDVPSMNEKRQIGSACVVDGLIWVFGGKGAKTVEFYDPATNKWQVSTNMDRQRDCPCVLSI
ncbi:unnamed protein product [Clavelina lepadiformis]|uniref:TIR domain-containing protein n=1 Tax=Clavelina lepadiformis TaxID=159417 RepID=A0ABP0G9A2_CLALP